MQKIKPRIKILIVDDHSVLRSGIRTILKNEKKKFLFDITEAATGKESIEKSKKSEFDFIIMDYSLPDMDGAEAIISILKYRPEVKVLGFSSFDENTCIRQMIEAGAKGYVLKSDEAWELFQAIENILLGESYFSRTINNKLTDTDSFKEKSLFDLSQNIKKREVRQRVKSLKINKYLFNIAESNKKLLVNMPDILFVTTDEIDPRNKIIYLKNKEHYTLMNYTLDLFLELSPALIQANKSELVSEHGIKYVNYDVIVLTILNEEKRAKEITLSRFYRENFTKYFH